MKFLIKFGFITWLTVSVLCLYFWVMNIVHLVKADTPIAEYGSVEVIQAVGIFVAPIGVVAGAYMEFNDE